MIIDANAHITEDGKWFNSNLDASVESLLKEMDKTNIERSVIVPIEGIISNHFVSEIVSKHKERFVPACSINPVIFNSKRKLVEHYKKTIGIYNFKFLKLHPRFHHYDLCDKKVFWLLEINEKIGLPLVVYICGYLYDNNIILVQSIPNTIHRIVNSFKSTRFVVLHAGGSWALHLYEAIKDNPNVFLDLSFSITKYKGSSLSIDINFLTHHFDRRLIWGSDFPEVMPEQALKDFNDITQDVSPEKKENILYKNVLNLLESNG